LTISPISTFSKNENEPNLTHFKPNFIAKSHPHPRHSGGWTPKRLPPIHHSSFTLHPSGNSHLLASSSSRFPGASGRKKIA
jgi:hypothetical protein